MFYKKYSSKAFHKKKKIELVAKINKHCGLWNHI